jgi:hypothetical protein|tara:strand:+ start:23892 stop:24677 length:786 start_codon:yes stop_codon:yes gene_type:complete
MEETVKKRGRKKKEIITESVPDENKEEPIKKKRGRKKKWETTIFKNNYINDREVDDISFNDTEEIKDDYSTNALSFGNLCIQVHDKEKEEETVNISDFFTEHNKDCNILVSSDEEDTCDVINENIKSVKHYNRGVDVTKSKQEITDVRCYNCHHNFECIPFYLPIDYCSKLKRYKLFGNFCSPNCVKSYCLNNKIFENKSYLVGQFYRALFGQSFRFGCAPSIYTLKEYGGDKTIEQFRKLSYTNSRYTLKNINTKVINIS